MFILPFDSLLSFLLPLAIALVPGVAAWWTGRRLAAHADDPELPERLIARESRLRLVSSLAVFVTIIVPPAGGIGWVPLIVLGRVVGNYGVRRRLFGESWSFGAYLWWTLRAIAAGGLILMVFITPLLVLLARPYHFFAAGGVGVLMLAWVQYGHRSWLWLSGAEPIEDAALRERFAEIARRAGGELPAVYRIGARGGRLANAFAYPHRRHPSVVFGRALLDLLDPDELAAVFAHELGHLEQYDARRLRRLRLRSIAVVCGAVLVPLLLIELGAGEGWTALGAGTVLMIALVWRSSRQSRADESAADRRAAELTGDPETVVRALTRLHAYSLLPRRWPQGAERTITHPSLVQRTRELRAVMGAAGPGLGGAIVLASPRAGSYVAFDEERASWFDGVPAGAPAEPEALREAAASVRSVAYAELADLRLRAGGESGRMLVARDRVGATWSLPVHLGDLTTVQRILERVDVHFPTPESPPSTVSQRVVAVLGAFFVAVPAGAFTLLFLPCLVALVWPAAPAMAALGTVTLGHVALRLVDGSLPWAATANLTALGILAALGAFAMWLSFRAPRPATVRPAWLLALSLAVAGMFPVLTFVTAASPELRRGELPAGMLALFLAGIGAGLLRLQPPMRRAGAVFLAAALPALLLSLGPDRLGGGPGIAWRRVTAAPGPSVPLDPSTGLEDVSSSGRYFALGRYHDRLQDEPTNRSLTVGDFSGFRRPVSAVHIAFPSDEHLLVLAARGDALELRLEPIRGGAPLWTRPIPPMSDPELAVDGAGRWSVAGTHEPARWAILVTAAGAGPVRILTSRTDGELGPPVALGERMLVLRPAPGEPGPLVLHMLGVGKPLAWEVRLANAMGERSLGTVPGQPLCSGPDATGVVCEVTANRRTVLWSIDTDGRMERVGIVPRSLFLHTLRGGVFAAVRTNAGGVVLIDPRTRRGTRLTGIDYARAAYPVPGGAVVQHFTGTGHRVTLFRTRP